MEDRELFIYKQLLVSLLIFPADAHPCGCLNDELSFRVCVFRVLAFVRDFHDFVFLHYFLFFFFFLFRYLCLERQLF